MKNKDALLRIAELEMENARLTARVAELGKRGDIPVRIRMPATRGAITHEFTIGVHRGCVTVGIFEDGRPGEVFIHMDKEGSTIGGLLDAVATLTSIALQFHVPIESLVRKFAYQRFEPSGPTRNPDIRHAMSVIDYIFRWLGCRFVDGYRASMIAHMPSNTGLLAPGDDTPGGS